jgi:hypothetical protein
VVLATVALVSVVFVAGAAAHRVKFESTVTAKFDKQANAFDGTVASAKRGCVTTRTVNLTLRATDGSTTVVGTAVTESNGAWVIKPASAPAAGTYFAEATKKVLRKNTKHRHVCAPAVSKDVKVK